MGRERRQGIYLGPAPAVNVAAGPGRLYFLTEGPDSG